MSSDILTMVYESLNHLFEKLCCWFQNVHILLKSIFQFEWELKHCEFWEFDPFAKKTHVPYKFATLRMKFDID